MPPRDHLPLWRLTREEPRRKHGFGSAPQRNFSSHGSRITREIEAATLTARARPSLPGVDPKLILKIELSNAVDENEWRKAGLHVLAQNPGNILVLFAESFELETFRARVAAFTSGPAGGRANPPYNGFVASIERVAEVGPKDRLGRRLVAEGITQPSEIGGRHAYVVDVELWDAGAPGDRQLRAFALGQYAETLGAQRVGQPFIGSSGFSLIRLKIRGAALRTLLERPEIASLDLPPLPDLGDRDPPSLTIRELPAASPPPPDAPIIGVIDSGLNDHPLLDDLVVERIAVPQTLGTADLAGHGTKVAGIAAYGDLRERLDQQNFSASVRILSVRVINDRGAFDDDTTVPAQMRTAVTALAARGCRIVNLSLGDKTLTPYAGGRASPWSAELDALARELDIVIIVSAGNAGSRTPPQPWGERNDAILTNYPAYLTSAENRILDPAIAANVVTVGALAHANGLRDDPDDGIQVQPIAERNEPSPVTRSGPGLGDAIKPDLVDYGGTIVFNGHVNRLLQGSHWASAGMLTLSDDYRRSLFTAASGTSYAAPRVAYKAAQIVRSSHGRRQT